MRDAPRVRRWKWKYLPRNVVVFLTPRWFLVQFVSRSGFAYSSQLRKWTKWTLQGQKQEVMNLVWEGPMKRKNVSSIASLSRHVEQDKMLSKFPRLSDWLTAASYEGEEGRRESPTLTLWASGGEWKATLKDRAESLVMWLSAGTLGQLLELMETFCQAEDGPWRHDDREHERNGKRQKK